jgi:hypothetical protein
MPAFIVPTLPSLILIGFRGSVHSFCLGALVCLFHSSSVVGTFALAGLFPLPFAPLSLGHNPLPQSHCFPNPPCIWVQVWDLFLSFPMLWVDTTWWNAEKQLQLCGFTYFLSVYYLLLCLPYVSNPLGALVTVKTLFHFIFHLMK